MWRRKGTTHNTNGEDNVMALVWLPMEGAYWGLLIMLLLISAHFHPKSMGWCFTVQMDKETKHTVKAAQEYLKAKILNILRWPSQSNYLNTIEQQLKVATVKARQSFSREENQN